MLPGGGKENYVWPSGYLLRSFGASMLHYGIGWEIAATIYCLKKKAIKGSKLLE